MLRAVYPPDSPPTKALVRFVQRFGHVVGYEIQMDTADMLIDLAMAQHAEQPVAVVDVFTPRLLIIEESSLHRYGAAFLVGLTPFQ